MLSYNDYYVRHRFVTNLVDEEGLEPPPLAGLVPKTSVASITPFVHFKLGALGRIRTYSALQESPDLQSGSVHRLTSQCILLFNLGGYGET